MSSIYDKYPYYDPSATYNIEQDMWRDQNGMPSQYQGNPFDRHVQPNYGRNMPQSAVSQQSKTIQRPARINGSRIPIREGKFTNNKFTPKEQNAANVAAQMGHDAEAKRTTNSADKSKPADVKNKNSFTDNGTGTKETIPKTAVEISAEKYGTGLGAGVAQGLIRRAMDPVSTKAEHLNNQAKMHDEAAARQQADAQRGYQIAGRDARVEGQKDAATRAAAQYGQTMNQISGAAGGGAAALASMNVQDPQADIAQHRERSDKQQIEAELTQSQAERSRQIAEQERNAADEANRKQADTNEVSNFAADMSAASGASVDTESKTSTDTKPTDTQSNPPANINTSDFKQLDLGGMKPEDVEEFQNTFPSINEGTRFGTFNTDPQLKEIDNWLISHGYTGVSKSETMPRVFGGFPEEDVLAAKQQTQTFSEGGFTGRGDKFKPAGIVHKGEYVIPKEKVNQITGLPKALSDARMKNIVGAIRRRA